MPRFMNQEDRRKRRDAILKDIKESDLSLREIADKFDMSMAFVYEIARGGGMGAGEKKAPISGFRILADLQTNGQTYDQIAAKHRCTKQYVSYVYTEAVKAGISLPKRSPGKHPKENP